jgi:hypothetical protein
MFSLRYFASKFCIDVLSEISSVKIKQLLEIWDISIIFKMKCLTSISQYEELHFLQELDNKSFGINTDMGKKKAFSCRFYCTVLVLPILPLNVIPLQMNR